MSITLYEDDTSSTTNNVKKNNQKRKRNNRKSFLLLYCYNGITQHALDRVSYRNKIKSHSDHWHTRLKFFCPIADDAFVILKILPSYPRWLLAIETIFLLTNCRLHFDLNAFLNIRIYSLFVHSRT